MWDISSLTWDRTHVLCPGRQILISGPARKSWDESIFSQSVSQFSRSAVSNSLWPHGLQHARLPYPHHLPELAQMRVHWVTEAIQPSHPVVPFASCLQSFPASGSFSVSQVFESEGPSTRASVSASVLAMNIQCWFLLELAGFIFLLCKGLSEVFSSTTVWKHWFFDAQPSLWSSFHTCTWLLEKP